MPDQPHNVKDVTLRLRTAPVEELPELVARYANDPRSGVARAVVSARKRFEHHQALIAHTHALYEEQRAFGGDGIVVGLDEVGRGAIAGPLTVGAVVLPAEPLIVGLDDSKKLTPEHREVLARRIREVATAIGIAHVPPDEIDSLGMSVCLRRAMVEALANTGVEPDAVLIDGNPLGIHRGETCIVKGDGRVAAIAAASILAKVARDQLMVAADGDYPGYDLAASKGYASPAHIDAVRTLGLTDFHRKTFCEGLLREQTSLF